MQHYKYLFYLLALFKASTSGCNLQGFILIHQYPVIKNHGIAFFFRVFLYRFLNILSISFIFSPALYAVLPASDGQRPGRPSSWSQVRLSLRLFPFIK